MLLNRPKDLFSGLIFAVIGIGAFTGALSYEIGSPNRMGPGFLPAAIGLLLLAAGVGLVAKAFVLSEGESLDQHALTPLVLILLGVTAFALLIDQVGLVPSLLALVLLSCGHRLLRHPLEVLAIFVGLSIFCSLLFVQLLGQNIPLFW